MKRAIVTGASGFIGHSLCRYLRRKGYWVYGIDIRPLPEEWSKPYPFDGFGLMDLRWPFNLPMQCDEVYALAADMGGMGYISEAHYAALRNNALININTADAILGAKSVCRVCFASSACVYPENMQMATGIGGLVEDDAWKGKPDLGYGVEKLFAEELYERLTQLDGFTVALPRFHNIYGPEITWRGGREKVIAALARKIAEAPISICEGKKVVQIEVWGDGEQTRSFCYIDDCLDALHALVMSGHSRPMNIGTHEAVSINDLAHLIGHVAGVEVVIEHVAGPQGVRGRNADLTSMHEVLGVGPRVSLEEGIRRTYPWIAEQVRKANK